MLAWCLREAVTNVIRHAGARSCRIRLIEHGPELSLEVTDDGRGFIDYDTQRREGPDGQEIPDGQDRRPASGQTTRGSGLRGMSERLSAVGGRLSLGPAHAGHPRRQRLPPHRDPELRIPRARGSCDDRRRP